LNEIEMASAGLPRAAYMREPDPPKQIPAYAFDAGEAPAQQFAVVVNGRATTVVVPEGYKDSDAIAKAIAALPARGREELLSLVVQPKPDPAQPNGPPLVHRILRADMYPFKEPLTQAALD